MGWKSGLAALALAVCAAAGSAAAEPGASYQRFEGRDYLLLWPAGTPTAVLVYLHLADTQQPLAYEASSGMLEALAADSALRNYVVVAPTAELNDCGLAVAAAAAQRYCWRLDALDDELGRIERLIAFIERNNEVTFARRMALGYGQGGDLLSSALPARRLDGYQKVGLIDAGPPPAGASLVGAASAGPLVYLEAAEGDQISATRARDLLSALVSGGYGEKTCARGDVGGAFYDVRRLAGFLNWFAQDCRVPTPSPTSAPADLLSVAPADDGAAEQPFAGIAEDEDGVPPRVPAPRSGPR